MSLYSRLFANIPTPGRNTKENFLTEAFVDLEGRLPLQQMVSLVADVLLVDAGKDAQSSWRQYVGNLSLKDFRWETQLDTKTSGRPDIVVRVKGHPVIVIEAKVDAPPSDRQLKTYDRWLSSQVEASGWPGALILLMDGQEAPSSLMFKTESDFRIQQRAVCFWSDIRAWLANVTSTDASSAFPQPAWIQLGGELVHFMAQVRVGHSRRSLRTISQQIQEEAENCFGGAAGLQSIMKEVFAATAGFRSRMSIGKLPHEYMIDTNRGLVWGWVPINVPVVTGWYVGWGLRIPSTTVEGHHVTPSLPDKPHIFVTVETDYTALPLKSPAAYDLPEGWQEWQGYSTIIKVKVLGKFVTDPSDMAESIPVWVCSSLGEIVPVIERMAASCR